MKDVMNYGIVRSENSKIKVLTEIDPDAFCFKKVEFEGLSFICQKKYSYLAIDNSNSNSKEGMILLYKNKPFLTKEGIWEDGKGDAFEFVVTIDFEGESKERVEFLTKQVFEI